MHLPQTGNAFATIICAHNGAGKRALRRAERTPNNSECFGNGWWGWASVAQSVLNVAASEG